MTKKSNKIETNGLKSFKKQENENTSYALWVFLNSLEEPFIKVKKFVFQKEIVVTKYRIKYHQSNLIIFSHVEKNPVTMTAFHTSSKKTAGAYL